MFQFPKRLQGDRLRRWWWRQRLSPPPATWWTLWNSKPPSPLSLSLFLSFSICTVSPSRHSSSASKGAIEFTAVRNQRRNNNKTKDPGVWYYRKETRHIATVLPACFYTQTADTDTTTKGACAPPLEWSDFPSCVIQTTRPPSVLMLLLFFFAKEINASLPFQTYVCTINEYFLASIIIFSFFFASLLLLQLDGDDCACVFVGPYSIRFGKRCECRHTTKHSKSSAR